jgi:hypothetical protein
LSTEGLQATCRSKTIKYKVTNQHSLKTKIKDKGATRRKGIAVDTSFRRVGFAEHPTNCHCATKVQHVQHEKWSSMLDVAEDNAMQMTPAIVFSLSQLTVNSPRFL